MRKVFSLFPVAFAGVLLLTGCGGDPKSAEKKAEIPAAAPLDEASAATITGKVQFTGEKPVARTISMDAVPSCASQHKGPIVAEDVVVNSNGTLKNAFVYVKSGLPSRQWPTPKTAVTMDQKGCFYSPRVQGIIVGQDLEISNNDPAMHNVHPMPTANREWNTSQAPKGEKIVKQFDKEEVMVRFKCNVHPWMVAYLGVMSHPFFTVTGEDGSFTLKGLPPGEYTVEAWHEKLGTQEMKITVAAKERKTGDFNFKN